MSLEHALRASRNTSQPAGPAVGLVPLRDWSHSGTSPAVGPVARPSMRRTAERYGTVPPSGTVDSGDHAFPQVDRLYQFSAWAIPGFRMGYPARPSRRDSRVTSPYVTRDGQAVAA